jgi:hypothetical protein
MIAEHRRLLDHVHKHESAVKKLDLPAMEIAGREQEASRMRIVLLEQRRRLLAQHLARTMNLRGEPTVRQIAALYPIRADALMQLRAELKGLIEQITLRTHVAGKVASAVLGHLNTLVRLVAGVVERAGLYTKKGIPRVSSRIGVMDAVG